MKTRILLFLAAFALSFTINAQTADEVLAKYFKASGGLDKMKAMKSVKMTGKAPTPQGELPLSMYMKTPNKIKMIFNVQGTEIVLQAFDGTTGWTLNPLQGGTTAVKLDEETTKELREEQFEDAFIDYSKKGHVVTLEGKEEIDGVQCYKIKLEKNKKNDKDDAIEFHYFDAENFIPIMTKKYVKTGPSKGTEIQTFLSDYQETAGLMLPYFLEQKVNGQTVFKIVLEKIIINENLDDSIFAYPGK